MSNPSPLGILRVPEYMCWLCRREIEPTPNINAWSHRPSLCRIIRFSQSSPSADIPARVSGVGYRLTSEEAPSDIAFAIPQNPNSSVTDSTIDTDDLDIISGDVYDEKARTWHFRVHTDCWDIVSSQADDPTGCATTWCKALASLNWNFSPFATIPSPGRYDLPQLMLDSRSPHKRHNKRPSLEPLSNLDVDNLKIELDLPSPQSPIPPSPISLSDLGLLPPPDQPPPQPAETQSQTPRTHEEYDLFARLPPAVIHHIICFLSTPDLTNLRLTSRTVAHASSLSSLSAQFWASRFAPRFEMGFVLSKAAASGSQDDWRSLYFSVKRALQSWQGSDGMDKVDGAVARLAKRKYWWGRLAGIVRLCDAWVGVEMKGEPFSQGGGIMGPLKCISSRMKRDDGEQRSFLTVCMPLDVAFGDVTTIGVSTVEMAGQTFVCGLRVYFTGERVKSLGYILESIETVVGLDPGEAFSGFGVRVDADAVRAVKVILRRRSGKFRVSPWIGDSTGRYAGVGSSPKQGVASLQRRSESVGCGFTASFDSFRMVAIGLFEAGIFPTGSELQMEEVETRLCVPASQQATAEASITSHSYDRLAWEIRKDPQWLREEIRFMKNSPD